MNTVINSPFTSGVCYVITSPVPPNAIPLDEKWVKLAKLLILDRARPATCDSEPYRPTHDGGKKIACIKLIREFFGIGLKDAKDSYECAYSVLVNDNQIRPS